MTDKSSGRVRVAITLGKLRPRWWQLYIYFISLCYVLGYVYSKSICIGLGVVVAHACM